MCDSTEFPSDPTNRRRDQGDSLADQLRSLSSGGSCVVIAGITRVLLALFTVRLLTND